MTMESQGVRKPESERLAPASGPLACSPAGALPPNEVRLKVWLIDEAVKHGVSPSSIYTQAFQHGKYPGITVRRATKRQLFVQLPAPERKERELKHPELRGLTGADYTEAWAQKKRKRLIAQGLTCLGKPRVHQQHSELAGLTRQEYRRAYHRLTGK